MEDDEMSIYNQIQEPAAAPEIAPREPVLVAWRNASTTGFMLPSGGSPLVLRPGLNVIAADRWNAYASHPPVAKAGLFALRYDESTPGGISDADLDLIRRTRDVAALDVLERIERAESQRGRVLAAIGQAKAATAREAAKRGRR